MKTPDEIRRHLKFLGFQQAPSFLDGSYFEDGTGEVVSTTPDGVYFNVSAKQPGVVQILIVGPMLDTPGRISKNIGLGLRVAEVEFVPPGDQDIRQTVLDRGFISVILEQVPVD